MFRLSGITDDQMLEVKKELVRGGDQNHPFHKYSVIKHTIEVVKAMRASTSIDMMGRVALLHDVGKAVVKDINESTGYDTFYNHATESIRFCNSIGINLTDMEFDLILEHDNCKGWVNKKKLHKLMREHGYEFGVYLILIVEADIAAQSSKSASKNMFVSADISTWMEEFDG